MEDWDSRDAGAFEAAARCSNEVDRVAAVRSMEHMEGDGISVEEAGNAVSTRIDADDIEAAVEGIFTVEIRQCSVK